MRVLQINGVIHQGSTGAIVDNISDYLLDHHEESFIAYGIGKASNDGYKFCYRYEQAFYRRISMLNGARYGYAPVSTYRLTRFINKCKPDIVHLHSINGNCVNIYSLLDFLKQYNYPTVITNHAEFFYTGNCTSRFDCDNYQFGCKNCPHPKWASDNALLPKTNVCWQKMFNAFSDFNNLTIVSVSNYSQFCSEKSPIVARYPHVVIMNGIDVDVFAPTYLFDIKRHYNIKAKRIAVFVTSEFSVKKEHLKGGYWLIDLAKRFAAGEYCFVVIGCDNPGIEISNVKFIGKITDKKHLANIYSQADIALGFSKSESFGMTCAESLCCGTPFVGFLCGGTESIAIKDYTSFVKYGDTQSLKEEIEHVLIQRPISKSEISDKARNLYSSRTMVEKYYSLYKRVYSNTGGVK